MDLSAGDFELASKVVYLFDEGNVFLQGGISVKRDKNNAFKLFMTWSVA